MLNFHNGNDKVIIFVVRIDKWERHIDNLTVFFGGNALLVTPIIALMVSVVDEYATIHGVCLHEDQGLFWLVLEHFG